MNLTNRKQRGNKKMKQLKVKEVSSILKKYVMTRDTRPVLQNANVTENHIIATDSHQLIRINRSIVENEFFTNETKLFDPKSSTYSNLEANYPEVDRLFPNHFEAELTITADNIKRSIEVINYFQHISGNKKNTAINITTHNNELVFGCSLVKEGELSEFYKTGIQSNEDVSITLNGEFFKNMLNSFKKVLKTIGQTEFKMNFISNMRPVLFETVNKELEILVLPIRTCVSLKDISIAENQDVTIEKKVTVKSVIKKVVLFVSGIVRKKAVEHEQINDFMTYLLKEDVTSVENETDQETKERRYNNLMLFAEIDGHLFHVGYVGKKDKLRAYTKNELMELLKESHENGIEAGKKVSVGMTQYLETIEEVETENHYNSEPEIEQGKNEGYLQHFSSNAVEIENSKGAVNMNSLLDKFKTVEIKNDTRITEADKEYCENQERMYKEAIEAMQQTLETFKRIHDTYTKDIHDFYNRGYIDQYQDIRHIEDRMKNYQTSFISNILSYFERTYSVTLRDEKVFDRYDFTVTYKNIIDEVFEQLGGFNFNEKAVNELKEKSREAVYNADKIAIKKNKLSIQSYIWWDNTWNDKKRIGWGDRRVNPLFKSLSHYETNKSNLTEYFEGLIEELQQGEEKYDIFNKYELGYNKVQSIKCFKNGKIEIEFQTMQQAEEFKREYLTK